MSASLGNAKKLAEEHWSYIEKLLNTHGEDPDTIKKIGFHYQSAFIHGYKHAMEDEDKPDFTPDMLANKKVNYN